MGRSENILIDRSLLEIKRRGSSICSDQDVGRLSGFRIRGSCLSVSISTPYPGKVREVTYSIGGKPSLEIENDCLETLTRGSSLSENETVRRLVRSSISIGVGRGEIDIRGRCRKGTVFG